MPPFRLGQKLVDIVACAPGRNWLFLIEAVHSANPLTPVRHQQLRAMMAGARQDFRKWSADIAWETEVWIAEAPDHRIHFNGDRFLGPHIEDGPALSSPAT